MKAASKKALRDYFEKAAYACMGMAAYGPRLWAAVALALAVVALVLNESTPRDSH